MFFVVIFFVPSSVMEHLVHILGSNMFHDSSKQKGDSRRNLPLIYLHDRLFVFMILGWMFRKKSCRDFTYTSKQIYFSCHHSSMEVYIYDVYSCTRYYITDGLFFTLFFQVKLLIIPACASASGILFLFRFCNFKVTVCLLCVHFKRTLHLQSHVNI